MTQRDNHPAPVMFRGRPVVTAGPDVLSGIVVGDAGTGTVTLSGRCGECGYLLGSRGHETACGDGERAVPHRRPGSGMLGG